MDNRKKLARLAEMGQEWDNDTPRKYDFMREEWRDLPCVAPAPDHADVAEWAED